jgi:hypothetical protein
MANSAIGRSPFVVRSDLCPAGKAIERLEVIAFGLQGSTFPLSLVIADTKGVFLIQLPNSLITDATRASIPREDANLPATYQPLLSTNLRARESGDGVVSSEEVPYRDVFVLRLSVLQTIDAKTGQGRIVDNQFVHVIKQGFCCSEVAMSQ